MPSGTSLFKARTEAPRCTISYQTIPSICLPSSEIEDLDCCFDFGPLTVRLSRCNNTQNSCLSVSITWQLQQTYSGRDQGAAERDLMAVLIRDVPARGAHGSLGLINQADTQSDTRRWGSSTRTLLWTPFLLLSPARRSPGLPASHMKWRACKWVMSAHNALLRHPSHSLVSALLGPQSPSSLFIFFTGISQNLDTQSVKPCPAPRAAKTAGKGKCTGLCINFFKSNSHF